MAARKSITEKFRDRLQEDYEDGVFNGFPLRLRRIRSRAVYTRGELPMIFADAYRRAFHPDYAEPLPAITDKDAADYSAFQMAVVVDCCIEPKLTLKPEEASDEVLLIDEVPDEVVEFIWRYATRAANFLKPGSATTEPEKEEVTEQMLTPFLHNGNGSAELDHVGERSEAVRTEAEPDAGHSAGNDVSAASHAGV